MGRDTQEQLKRNMKEQSDKIGQLSARISNLTDKIAILENELKKFQAYVTQDMNSIVETIRKR
jgi:TolA-binding protein|tara:strand:- start:392 stop:580 length:189 start_codon:yes stop_codon:yes gene_type:complete